MIDLTDVGFIDSAGLGALIGALRRARDSRQRIALCCKAPALLRLFDTVGLTDVVTIEPDRKRALDAVRDIPSGTGCPVEID